jgi:hypothetical protein
MSFLPGLEPSQNLTDMHDGAGDTWLTPPHILDAVQWALGSIELDPCSHPGSPAHKRAERSYCLSDGDDGLALPWDATAIFVNCPYSDVAPWLERCRIASSEGSGVIALVPTRPETRAWRKSVFEADGGAFVIQQTGRIRFIGSDGKTHGNGMVTTCFIAWHEGIALDLQEGLADVGIASTVLRVMQSRGKR